MPKTSEPYIIIIFWGTLILSIIGVFVVLFIFQYQRKHNSFLKAKAAFNETLLQSQLEMQEQTMKHISRELHDNVSQVASLIKINLATIPATHIENVDAKLNHTKDLVRSLMADLKSLSVNLSGDRLGQLGFTGAIHDEIERINKTGVCQACYNGPANFTIADESKSLIIFRMVQELLNNALKHSECKHIEVQLNNEPTQNCLLVKDDGVGFDVAEASQRLGAGLNNLKARAAMVGGEFILQSNPGEGTTAGICLPVTASKA